MSWFSIPNAFKADTLAKSAQVNENFDKVEEAFNGLFQMDTVAGEGELILLTTNYQDVPGASVTLTPAIPSLVRIDVVFGFVIPGVTLAFGQALGSIKVDSGSEQDRAAVLEVPEPAFPAGATVPQSYTLSLAAGSHTIKMRAKKGASGNVKVFPPTCSLSYLMIPDPEP
jgi:hypothetical protein